MTQKIGIARQEQSRLASELSAKGVRFNADGTIANYAQAYDAQLNYVNGIVDQYNAMTAEEQESFKKTLEKAKEDFDNFTEAISEYDKTVTDIIPELESSIQDAVDKQIEIQISKFDMEIQIRLDLKDAELQWNEFKKKVIDGIKETDILGNQRARLQDFDAYYKNDGTGIIQRNTQHVNDILGELQKIDNGGHSGVYSRYNEQSGEWTDDRVRALEDLQKYYQQLITFLKKVF